MPSTLDIAEEVPITMLHEKEVLHQKRLETINKNPAGAGYQKRLFGAGDGI